MRAEAGELEIQLQWRSSKILQVRVASNPLEILLRVGQVRRLKSFGQVERNFPIDKETWNEEGLQWR